MGKGHGGIFDGPNALGTLGLGIDPPFPDVYGCNTNDQCQSGWCNTAIPAGNAAGQCQTKGKVNPSIGGGGEGGAYCSSTTACAPGLTCNEAKKMCESPSDPGNGCYIATQMGFQAGQAGLSNGATAASLSAAVQAGVFPSPAVLSALTSCYNDGYAQGKKQASENPCNTTANIKKVQSGLGRPATGTWTTDDANALAKSGKPFRTWAPMCTGTLPTPVKTSTPAVKPPVPPPVIVPVQPPVKITPMPGGTTEMGLLSNPLALLAIGAVVIGGIVIIAAKKKGKSKGKGGKKGGKSAEYRANKSRRRQRAAKKAWRTRRRNAKRGLLSSLFG